MPSRTSPDTTPDPVTRLLVQAAAWAPASATTFDRLGVRPGWACCDLGCGPLGVLDLLSDRVGRRGQVVGVERHPALLLAAMATTAGRRNVRLHPGDATRTGLPAGSFDLVHARLVCQEAGAGPLLREMIRLARPGGVIVLAEPGPEPWEIDPAPADYRRLRGRVAGRFLRRRSAAGPRLAQRLRVAGLVGIATRCVRLEFAGGHPYAGMPGFALAGARSFLLRSGAATGPDLRRLALALEKAAADPAVRHRTFPLCFVSGRISRRPSL